MRNRSGTLFFLLSWALRREAYLRFFKEGETYAEKQIDWEWEWELEGTRRGELLFIQRFLLSLPLFIDMTKMYF